MNIYVGNLPYSTTEDDLRNLFSEHGEVQSANVISDRETGRSKGFGFVIMDDAGEAQNAIKAFDGHDMGGRAMRVNEARPREDRSRRSY
ncbi:MAG: RNA-binding protein [Pseudomonadota bacterium]